jgi:hypothetical protein
MGVSERDACAARGTTLTGEDDANTIEERSERSVNCKIGIIKV